MICHRYLGKLQFVVGVVVMPPTKLPLVGASPRPPRHGDSRFCRFPRLKRFCRFPRLKKQHHMDRERETDSPTNRL